MLREPQETPGSPRRPQEPPWRPQEAPEGPHADSACVFYVCACGLPFSCGSNPTLRLTHNQTHTHTQAIHNHTSHTHTYTNIQTTHIQIHLPHA